MGRETLAGTREGTPTAAPLLFISDQDTAYMVCDGVSARTRRSSRTLANDSGPGALGLRWYRPILTTLWYAETGEEIDPETLSSDMRSMFRRVAEKTRSHAGYTSGPIIGYTYGKDDLNVWTMIQMPDDWRIDNSAENQEALAFFSGVVDSPHYGDIPIVMNSHPTASGCAEESVAEIEKWMEKFQELVKQTSSESTA